MIHIDDSLGRAISMTQGMARVYDVLKPITP
jgi:hypothetical protein